jgi:hypothetical protein
MDYAGSNHAADDVNPADMEKYIRGLSYPAKKIDVMYTAMANGAPEDVMKAISDIHERDAHGDTRLFYDSLDVTAAIPHTF